MKDQTPRIIEKHLIGAMMVDREAAEKAARLVKPSDFDNDRHTRIFAAMLRLILGGFAVDLVTVSQALRDSGDNQDEYLMEVSAEVVSAANLDSHCKAVREYSLRREAIKQQRKNIETLLDLSKPISAAMAEIETETAALRGQSEASYGIRVVPTEEMISLALKSYDEKVYHGESTGWAEVDKFLRIAPGQLNVVTGVPNHGKSEWLDALMLNLATGSGWRIGFFSPENSPLRRHIQKMAEKRVRKRLYGQARMSRQEFEGAVREFIAKHFVFLDQGINGATFDQVLSEFNRISPRLNACVIDPWNRLEIPETKENETDYVKSCLKRGARFVAATGISLWVVAHPQKIRRDPKSGQLSKPGPYDISGSAHWYNIPDNIVMIWRNFETGRSEIHLQKVRWKDNGTVGMVEQNYEVTSGNYSDLDVRDKFMPSEKLRVDAPAPPFYPKGKYFPPSGLPDGDKE